MGTPSTKCLLGQLLQYVYWDTLYNKFIGTPCSTCLLGHLVQCVHKFTTRLLGHIYTFYNKLFNYLFLMFIQNQTRLHTYTLALSISRYKIQYIYKIQERGYKIQDTVY